MRDRKEGGVTEERQKKYVGKEKRYRKQGDDLCLVMGRKWKESKWKKIEKRKEKNEK